MGKSGDGPTTDLGWLQSGSGSMQRFFGKGYHVYCDNYFASVYSAADLLEHGPTLV